MAEEIERLIVRMEANVAQFEQAMKRANRAAYGSAAQIKKELDKIKRDLDRTGREAGQAFVPMQQGAQLAFAAITAYSIKAAADAAEIENAFNVAFGSSAKAAKAFAVELANEVGRSVTEIQSGMSRMQLVLTGMGVSGEKALKITEALTKRAVDIGSLWNVSDAEALQAIISGISGESEPMKRFGAVINETAVKAELLRLGFKGNAEQASDMAKAVARANLILQKTASANGDAARTADSTANQFKRARAEFHDAAIELGNELLPAVTKLTASTADLLDEFGKLPDGVKLGGLALLGLVAASGPVAAVIGGLAKLISYAKAARVALAGVAAAQGGAAAAGAAGAGAGAAFGMGASVGIPALGFAAVGVSTLNARGYASTLKNLGAADADRLTAAQRYAQANIEALKRQGGADRPGRANERLTRFQTELGQVVAELQRRAILEGERVAAEADKAAAAAVAGLGGGFGLSGDELKTQGRGAGKDAERLRQQALDREARVNLMIARADDERLAARLQLAVEADERLKLELEAVDRERRARREDLRLAVQQGEIEKAQAEKVDAAEEAARLEREANLRREAEIAARDDAIRAEQEIADFTAELLSASSGLARTAEERRKIELELLALHQDERRRALERAAADKTLTAAQRASARLMLERLGELEAAERRAVERSSMGPLEAWRDAGLKSAGELSEAFEGVAVRGLEALNDQLVDAVVNFRSLGDVARSVARQIQADLVQIGVRRFITEPLADLLFPKSGGGGGILGAIAGVGKAFAGFFGAGGTIPAGKWGIAGEKGPEPVLGPAMVLPNAALRGPGRGVVHQHFSADFRGAVVTEELIESFKAYADQVGVAAATGGISAAAGVERRIMRRGRQRLGGF